MKTINEEIEEALTRHQIYVVRYGGAMRNATKPDFERYNKLLKKAMLLWSEDYEPDADYTSGTTKRLIKSLTRIVSENRSALWGAVGAIMNEKLVELGTKEVEFTHNVFEKTPLEFGGERVLVANIDKLLVETPFEGATLAAWLDRSEQVDTNRINNAVITGIQQNEDVNSLIARVHDKQSGVVNKSWNNADALAYTAVNHASNTAREAVLKQPRYRVEKEYFIATLDGRTTFLCAGNDRGIHKVGEGPRPPLHFRCRSLRVPYFDPEGFSERAFDPSTERILLREYAEQNNLGTIRDRANLPRGQKGAYDKWARRKRRERIGQLPLKVTFEDFMKKQSDEFQNEYFGITRANMFRKGEFTLKEFVNPQNDVLTIEQLNQRLKDV